MMSDSERDAGAKGGDHSHPLDAVSDDDHSSMDGRNKAQKHSYAGNSGHRRMSPVRRSQSRDSPHGDHKNRSRSRDPMNNYRGGRQ